ncbi:MAG: bifunctional oligoribonuclease/PAP phosphatase NrnA [Saprospiraceae bacterium]|nr:bifunctional oligoribonuclease/PAP phosphatase NrnA [Saprospiraceae bacterium]
MVEIEQVKKELSRPRNVVITSHRNPDGDALGSSLAMWHWLNQMGHKVTVIFPSEYPASFFWMKGADQIRIYDLEPEEIDGILEAAEVSIMLDYNSLQRIDKLGEKLQQGSYFNMLIDHHLYPDPLGDYILSDTTASSTCELVYRFIKEYADGPPVDLTIAECLYTGIITDTGSFQYATSAALFRTVADLKDIGVDNHYLHQLIFQTLEEKNLRLLGHCIYNRMEILEEYQTGIFFLNKHDFQVFDIQRGDTEGIVNYLLKLKNVKCAVFFRQQQTIVKISFRSKGDFSVEEIAKTYFNGGGHKNAAGGYWKKSLASAIDKFKEVLPEYKTELEKSIYT